MANKIQFLRGPQSGIDESPLAYGQPAFTDAGKLYIGNSDGTTKTLINGGDHKALTVEVGTIASQTGDNIIANVETGGSFNLINGALIVLDVTTPVTLTASSMLNVDGTGPKAVSFTGNDGTVLKTGASYLFVYYEKENTWLLTGNLNEDPAELESADLKAGTDTVGKTVSAKTLNDWLAADGNSILKSGAYTEVGTASGQIPVLGADGKLPTSLLGDDLLGNVKFQGIWDAATNSPELPAEPTADDNGHYYIVSAAGTFASIDFNVGDWIIAAGTEWKKVDNTDAVSSVAGLTGVITLDQLKAAGLEGAIEAGTADQYLNGEKTWTDFGTSTRATVLTGLVTTSTAAVEATDTVLIALGKLQGQSALHAPLASPEFTGVPTAPTAEASANNNQIATTEFVKSQNYLTADSTIDGGTF